MLFCVNTSVSQASVWRRFLRVMFFCARDFCLTVRAFWRAEELRWVEKDLEEMREVDQCSDEMKTVLWRTYLDDMWEVRRDEMRREELTWFEMRWSVECEVQVWSAGCEECSVKCEESLRLALHCAGVARRSCSWTTTPQTASHKARTHGPGWRTAHASSIDEKGLIV